MGCDCESCEDACPCIGGFPQLWSIFLLLLSGGVMITASAMYALISLRTSILLFAWAAPYGAYLNSAALGVGVGCGMLVLALLTWCAFRGDGCAAAFKAIFAVLLFCCTVGAIATAYGAFTVVTGMSNQRSKFASVFEQTWLNEVKGNRTVGAKNERAMCKVQERLRCHGFKPGDCTGDRGGELERCDRSCGLPTNGSGRGCYFVIAGFYKRWNLPLAVTSVVSALFSVIAFVVLITTVSFNLNKQKGNV